MAIDIILILFAILGFWLGYTKGIVATLFSILEYVLAALIMIAFSPFLSVWLISAFNLNHIFAIIIGSFVFFILSILLFKWLTKKIEATLKKGRLSGSMKILGGVVMMIVSILLYTVILWLVNYNGFINEKIKLASISYSTLAYVHAGMSSWIADLKPLFGRYWNLIQDSVKESQPPSTG